MEQVAQRDCASASSEMFKTSPEQSAVADPALSRAVV